MRLIVGLAAIVMAMGVGFALYVRFAPSDPGIWHVDPRTAPDLPRTGAYVLRDGAGNGPAVQMSETPQDALARFDQIARKAERVSVLSGSVAEGHITYIARSRIWGFPDYISVVAYPSAQGAQLAILSRLRFGHSDFGVNAARVQAWVAQL